MAITWKNVAAPNFSGVARINEGANASIQRSTDGLSDMFKGFGQQFVDRDTNAAIKSAMGLGNANTIDADGARILANAGQDVDLERYNTAVNQRSTALRDTVNFANDTRNSNQQYSAGQQDAILTDQNIEKGTAAAIQQPIINQQTADLNAANINQSKAATEQDTIETNKMKEDAKATDFMDTLTKTMTERFMPTKKGVDALGNTTYNDFDSQGFMIALAKANNGTLNTDQIKKVRNGVFAHYSVNNPDEDKEQAVLTAAIENEQYGAATTFVKENIQNEGFWTTDATESQNNAGMAAAYMTALKAGMSRPEIEATMTKRDGDNPLNKISIGDIQTALQEKAVSLRMSPIKFATPQKSAADYLKESGRQPTSEGGFGGGAPNTTLQPVNTGGLSNEEQAFNRGSLSNEEQAFNRQAQALASELTPTSELGTNQTNSQAAPTELIKEAAAQGITDPTELNMMQAQFDHETGGYKHMVELGAPSYFNKYEPGTNIGKTLGNTEKGDGAKYKGRGYTMLTGRDNYTRAGKALSLDLVNKPELAEVPANARKIAVWYWKSRGLGEAARAGNVEGVTQLLNGGANGLDNRMSNFQALNR